VLICCLEGTLRLETFLSRQNSANKVVGPGLVSALAQPALETSRLHVEGQGRAGDLAANQLAVIMHVPASALAGSKGCAPSMLCVSSGQPAGGGQALGSWAEQHHRPDLELRLNCAALARMRTSPP
jgi:hypothetical protein